MTQAQWNYIFATAASCLIGGIAGLIGYVFAGPLEGIGIGVVFAVLAAHDFYQ